MMKYLTFGGSRTHEVQNMIMNRSITQNVGHLYQIIPVCWRNKNQLKYSGSDISMILVKIAFVVPLDTKVWTTTSRLGF